MSTSRPISRVCLVLPAQKESGESRRPLPSLDAVADLMAQEMSRHGVAVTRHVVGAAPERGARADVALWLPGPDAALPAPSLKDVPARCHVGVLADPEVTALELDRYDGVLPLHPAFAEPARLAGERVSGSPLAIAAALLPGAPLNTREAEKAARRLPKHPVVVLDVRGRFDADIDRVIFQLALKNEPATLALLTPAEDAARNRVRALCERQGVDAWMASGPAAFAAAVGAVDLFIGHPSWDELWLAAAHQTAVTWLGGEGTRPPAIIAALHGRELDEVGGVLQLGAYLDRCLLDRGSLAARGTMLRAACVADARGFLDALGTVKPRARQPHGPSAWERVGPHAQETPGPQPGIVDAKANGDAQGAQKDRAAQIEDALSELKARMASES